jgi:hypothetical protein
MRVRSVSKLLSLEEKHRLLKEMLRENMEKKHYVEVNIREQLEELKKLEISLEKMRTTQQRAELCFLVRYSWIALAAFLPAAVALVKVLQYLLSRPAGSQYCNMRGEGKSSLFVQFSGYAWVNRRFFHKL